MAVESPRKIKVAVCIVACACVLLLAGNLFVDWFVRSRITRALADAAPGISVSIDRLHYSVLRNRLVCDSVTVRAADSTVRGSVGEVTVSGISRMKLLGGSGAFASLETACITAEKISIISFKSGYKLECGRASVSLPDSGFSAEVLAIHPVDDEEKFFSGSKFRRTRYIIGTDSCRSTGLDVGGFLRGQTCRSRNVRISGITLSILIDKYKPVDTLAAPSAMPNVFLPAFFRSVHFDSLMITDGQVKYGEQFSAGAMPAVLTFTRVRALEHESPDSINHSNDMVIQAGGEMMGSGEVSLSADIPAGPGRFDCRYSGRVGSMDLACLNPYLEIAEQKRIKSGRLSSASVDVTVTSGKATGTVNAEYRDLKIVLINGSTGSESGILNTLASLVANNIKLRTSNLPDNADNLKIGKVFYAKQNGETFFEFAWFAVRSGIGDVVRF
jgi:hypothetical protein